MTSLHLLARSSGPSFRLTFNCPMPSRLGHFLVQRLGRVLGELAHRAKLAHVVLVGLIAIGGCDAIGSDIRPPNQPESGPGGSDYRHASILTQRIGAGIDEYWIFFPDDPRPESAPVVVFLHGWTALDPLTYGGWIEHIVLKGHIAVYPRYQLNIFSTPAEMEAAAAGAISAAWQHIQVNGRVLPQSQSVVWIGHSLGGTFASILAARSFELGLPPPAAIMMVQPGASSLISADNRSRLPVGTRVLFVVGEDDSVVGRAGVDALLPWVSHIPSGQVELVTMRTDRRPTPQLVADHTSPLSVVDGFPPTSVAAGGTVTSHGRRPGEGAGTFAPSSLDYFGYWKLTDGLLDFVFRNENLEYAFGDTEQQRFMGIMSNGEPVQPMVVERPLGSE